MFPQLNVPHFQAMLFIVSCIKELELLQTEKYVLMLWGRTGREEVCCCIGNIVMNVHKNNLNIIFSKKVLFSVLLLLPKADKEIWGLCWRQTQKAIPTRSSVLQYSAIQLCLWRAKFLPCLSAYKARKIPTPWDAEDRIFFLSLLQLSTCSHSHFTHCLTISSPSRWLSQTSSAWSHL